MIELTVERVTSPVGTLQVVCDGAGVLRAIDLHDDPAGLDRLLDVHCPDRVLSAGRVPKRVTAALAAYFEGDVHGLDVMPVQTGGTDFQRSVWSALRRIPAGTTWSYGRLAAEIGNPRASRAVGLANGANPVSIVVPCHRVIGASGQLTGYGGGLPRKRWLLDHELRSADRRATGKASAGETLLPAAGGPPHR